ncbi:bacteriophage P2 Tail completion protein GPR [Cupriavidus taiwanensis]|uniref:phage tail protein n=1 Tax=Cupriavidus taiwanensis TaxID=164546 RepID=UPI000E14AD3A|nr:phage tail protein [Cupriavidus taiwanensis]SOZ15583.1 bacteriophage P2 Tail completion protein GPR [Cupriavidus taiwanensis]SOZ27845.1 bacteriophage P2 Tail completion protein GPR [Cupriavidus taiwanensis]SOZ46152.1 bacteriophage P2 Tail completion protein GPR [Cupriavidus taiwanensis]SPA14276.1 bacteriophage P2 Tail completion protein GPR [Cupriavidus taiwanensis]
MMKPNSLREALTTAVPDLARHPEKLHVFVDEGRLVATGARSLSFEYRYTLTLIVTDFAAGSDEIMVPVLAWLRVNQPELFFSPTQREDGVKFEADILNHTTVDLALKLPLTERVTVRVNGAGYLVEHHPEPVNEEDDPSTWLPATP